MEDLQHFFAQMQQGLQSFNRMKDFHYRYNARTLIFSYDKVKLYHYQAKQPKQLPPLLIVFATVNRPEILDLFPEQSFIGNLIKHGGDIYLLDWGYPDKNDTALSLNDYITKYLHQSVQCILGNAKVDKINLLGICQGGLLCLSYALLTNHIKNLILISTPIDFHTQDNVIAAFLKKLDVEKLIKIYGNIPGAWLTQFFIALRPFELIGQKYLRFVDHLQDVEQTEKFLRVEKWLHDAPDQAGYAFTELVNDFYQQNKLVKGEIIFADKKIDLTQLAIPVLNVIAGEDQIVPPSASRALKKYLRFAKYSQRVFPSGHIGMYVNDKINLRMAKTIIRWLMAQEKSSS